MLHKKAVEPNTLELLEKICQLPELTSFGLGGGTSIALRKGHRLSTDLDFFTDSPFDTVSVYKTITTHFNDFEGGKAANPVVATNGKFMAFQSARSSDPPGVGHGLLLYYFDNKR